MDRREYAECFQKLVDCFVKEEKFIQDIVLMDKPNLDEIEQNAVLSYRAAKDISRHFLFYLNSCRCPEHNAQVLIEFRNMQRHVKILERFAEMAGLRVH